MRGSGRPGTASSTSRCALPLDVHLSLVEHTPLGVTWTSSDRPFDAEVLERLRQRVDVALSTGLERTEDQDIGYGKRQLTDVTSKALSPGVNDPTTAVHALGHLSALLCELVGLDLGARLPRDEDGLLRVALARPSLTDLLEPSLTQPRRYGRADPSVLARLLTLLRELGWVVEDPVQRHAVADQLDRLRATLHGQDVDPTETERLDALAELVEHALEGRWPVRDVS